MKTTEIRERGRMLGLALPARMRKGEMIRTIQQTEGNQSCFGAPWRFDCPQHGCCWRGDCLTKQPG